MRLVSDRAPDTAAGDVSAVTQRKKLNKLFFYFKHGIKFLHVWIIEGKAPVISSLLAPACRLVAARPAGTAKGRGRDVGGGREGKRQSGAELGTRAAAPLVM